MNIRLYPALIAITFSLVPDLFAGLEPIPPFVEKMSLEEQVRYYLGHTDVTTPRILREKILSYPEEELKPVLEKIALEPIERPENDYARLEELAFLSLGLADRDFAIRLMRKVVLRFKDLPFDVNLPFFRDYLERDPEGAEATFRKLVEIGNENVRGYAEGYLAEIAKGRKGVEYFPHDRHSSNESAGGNPALEPDGDSSAGDLSWLLVALGGAAVLGIGFVLLRSRLRR